MEKKKTYPNIPPKDIQNRIHGACFDYKDFEADFMGEQVQDRIYECWNGIHLIVKNWIESEGGEQDFLNYIKNNIPDTK